jgi:hypothetical protein
MEVTLPDQVKDVSDIRMEKPTKNEAAKIQRYTETN